jgi:hypothetical protein
MNTEAASRLMRRYLVFTHVTSLTAIVVGSLVLLGWQLEIALLKSLLPGYATMKPNTAACFVLAGAALWLPRVGPGQMDNGDSRRTSVAQACAALVALVGLLTLGEYLLNLNIGLDELLFRDTPHPAHLTPPGRMAPVTALAFVLLGSALTWLEAESRWRHRLSQFLALLTALVGLISFLGYLYGAEVLYRVFPYSSMALHTALLLLVLSVGVLSARPDRNPLALFLHDHAGSVMARRLLPVVIFFPIVIAWVGLMGQQANLYSTEFSLALFATSTIVILNNRGLVHCLVSQSV